MAKKHEPQTIEKVVTKEVPVTDPEDQKTIKLLREQMKKLKDAIRFCYDISGGMPREFQRLFGNQFPEFFEEEPDQRDSWWKSIPLFSGKIDFVDIYKITAIQPFLSTSETDKR